MIRILSVVICVLVLGILILIRVLTMRTPDEYLNLYRILKSSGKPVNEVTFTCGHCGTPNIHVIVGEWQHITCLHCGEEYES